MNGGTFEICHGIPESRVKTDINRHLRSELRADGIVHQ